MQSTSKAQIVGIHANKDIFVDESGKEVPFDFTKVIVLQDFSSKNDKAMGKNAVSYKLGDSSEINKYRGLTLPFEAELDFEMVSTTGGKNQVNLLAIRPIKKPV